MYIEVISELQAFSNKINYAGEFEIDISNKSQ